MSIVSDINNKKNYVEIDALKGFAIFLVILGHAIILYPINLHDNNICLAIFDFVSIIHMPLFFIISGFCFSWNDDYKAFVTKKVKRLIVPYIVFNLIDMIPRQLFPELINRPRSMLDSLTNMLFYGGEYWFLYTLFIIFLIYPLIYKWQAKSYKRKILVEIILGVLTFIDTNITLFTINHVIYYILYFNTGVLIRNSDKEIFEKYLINKRLVITIIVSFLTILCVLVSFQISHLKIVIAFLGIIVSYLLTKFQIFNLIFERFGKYSLQLYLLNGFWLVISRTIICKVTGNPLIIIVFNMIVDFAISYLFIKYFCQRFKLTKKVMGMS